MNVQQYGGLICGIVDEHDVPRKSYDFALGADGNVWTFFRVPYADAPALLLKIDQNLDITVYGNVVAGQAPRILFEGLQLLLTGTPTIRRVKPLIQMNRNFPSGKKVDP